MNAHRDRRTHSVETGPAAVVLDLSPNGLAVVRNLARRGVTVVAVDREPNLSRGRSHLARCLVCPDPAVQKDAFVNFMIRLGGRFSTPPVLFTAADDFVETVSDRRSELAPYYRFLLPEPSVVSALLDKRATADLARHHGFPAPATWVPSGDLDHLPLPVEALPYPCLLKPARSYRFRRAINRKVMTVRNPAELRAAYARVRGAGPVMIQEVIPGGDDAIYQVGFLRTPEGQLLARFAGRKLLQYPPGYGSGALAVAEAAPDAVELATRIVETLDLPGLCNVELKRDARDGRLKLIEIDPRLWLWHDLGRAAGVDLAWAYYELLAGRHPAPRLRQQDGLKWVHELRAPVSAWSALRRGERNWRRLLADFRGIACLALLDWCDPLPFARFALAACRRRVRSASPGPGPR